MKRAFLRAPSYHAVIYSMPCSFRPHSTPRTIFTPSFLSCPLWTKYLFTGEPTYMLGVVENKLFFNFCYQMHCKITCRQMKKFIIHLKSKYWESFWTRSMKRLAVQGEKGLPAVSQQTGRTQALLEEKWGGGREQRLGPTEAAWARQASSTEYPWMGFKLGVVWSLEC